MASGFPGRYWPRLGALILPALYCLAAAAIYLPTLDYPPVWDDHDFFEQNEQIRSLRNIPQFFVAQPRKTHGGVFRPLVYVYHTIFYRLGGGHPAALRIFLVLCSILTSLALVPLVRRAMRDLDLRPPPPGGMRVPEIAGLLFLLHPVHVEAIVWLSGGGYCVSGMFYVVSFALFQRHRHWASLILFGLGLLTTEMVVTLPLLVAIYAAATARTHRFVSPARPGRSLAALGSYWILLIVYLVYRYAILGKLTRGIEPYGGSVWLTLLSMARVLVDYIQLMVWPGNLLADHAFAVLDWASLGYVLFIVELVLLGVLAFAFVRTLEPVAWYFLGWFFITLLPVSNLIPSGGTPEAERYLYIPSAGAMVVVATLAGRMSGWCVRFAEGGAVTMRPFVARGVLGLLLFFGGRAMVQARAWRSEEALWDEALLQNITSSRPHANYCGTLWTLGDLPGALACYRRAERWTGEFQADIASVYLDLGDSAQARPWLERALAARPADAAANRIAAKFLMDMGQIDSALTHVQRIPATSRQATDRLVLATIALLKGDSSAYRANRDTLVKQQPAMEDASHYLLAYYYDSRHLDSLAVVAWRAGLRPSDTSYAGLTGYAISLAKRGRDQEAEFLLRRAVERYHEWQTWHNLGYFYITRSRYRDAREALERAMVEGGDHPELMNDLAHAAIMLGDTTRADAYFTRLAADFPTFHRPYAEIGRMYRRHRQNREARDYLEQYRMLNERSANAYAYLGDYFTGLGDRRRGHEYYHVAMELARGDSATLATLRRETGFAAYEAAAR